MRKLYSFRHPRAKRVQTPCEGKSLTQGEFAKELDVNYLIEKHVRTGQPFPTATPDMFADVSDAATFQQAQDAIVRARNAWMSVPAKTRRYFGDNINTFLEALRDPEQVEDLVRLGVMEKVQNAPKNAAGGSQDANPKAGEAPAPKGQEGGGKPPGTVVT